MKKIILLLLIATSSAFAGNNSDDVLRVKGQNVQSFPGLGPVCLSYNGQVFTVYHEGEAHNVALYDTDPILQLITKEHLEKFLAQGSIRVNRMDDGSYTLKAIVPGKGGLLPGALIAYGVVKGVGLGIPIFIGIKAAGKLITGGGDPALGKVASNVGGKVADKVIGSAVGNATTGTIGSKIANVYVECRTPEKAAQDVMAVGSVGGGYYAAVETAACAAYELFLRNPWF